MQQFIGKQSIQFERPPAVLAAGSIAGKKEEEGPLTGAFDLVEMDPKVGKETWEEAESALQKRAVQTAVKKAGLTMEQIRYIFGGDLLGQSIATSFGSGSLNVPFFGLYGACSTCGESLSLAAMTVAAGYAKQVVAVTSSHFGSAEKEFRFPLDYGNQRPPSATWTVTGSGAFVLGEEGSNIQITGITTGKIIDYGIKDSMNMGAAMAPAATDTIYSNLCDFERQPGFYDAIVTGDLGRVGSEILVELLLEKGFDIRSNHRDCGMEIYDDKTQDTHAGGSGCGCAALVLAAKFLPEMKSGKLSRILLVPTGALLSKVSFQEGQTIPGIAHGVVLERVK